MTTTPIDHAPVIRVGSIHAEFLDSTLDVFMGDDCLSTVRLHTTLDMDIDSEVIPILVGVGWSGDHTGRAQIHFPNRLDVDPESGEEASIWRYDRLGLIDAAIDALQRTRDVVAHTKGRLTSVLPRWSRRRRGGIALKRQTNLFPREHHRRNECAWRQHERPTGTRT